MKSQKSLLRNLVLKVLSLVFFLALGCQIIAAEVKLAWDPSPDAGVASYQIHYGITSGSYRSVTNAGLATELTITGLTMGVTYYFAATAVGTNQLESDFSNEISYTPPLPTNTPPTITAIGGQTINEDGIAGPLSFNVGDAQSPAGNLTLSATSSNPSLVPIANITFGGSGANRSVTIAPLANAWGTAQITVTVSDGELSAFRQFTLTVNSINDAPTLTAISGQSIDEDGIVGPVSFTVADVETAPGSLTLSGNSSNPTLVPNGNITFGGNGANRTVTIRPSTNQTGSAQITVSVSDGSAVGTRVFTVTVNPVNDAPTITAIVDQTIDEDKFAGPISFTITDVESSASSLTLNASSSNPTLLPVGNIVFGGSGANRTVTLTPAPDQFGTCQITISVSDGELSAGRSFTLTVNSVPDALTPPGNLRRVLGAGG